MELGALTMASASPDPHQALLQLGLNEDEAKLYQSLLELGRATVGELSLQASHSRAKIYGLLDNLTARGIVKVVSQHPLTYVPEDPLEMASNRLSEVEAAVKLTGETLGPLFKSGGAQMAEVKTFRDLDLYREVERLVDLTEERMDLMVALMQPEGPPAIGEKIKAAARNGIPIRVLVPERIDPPRDPEFIEVTEVRVAPTPAAGMLIIDDSCLAFGGTEGSGAERHQFAVTIRNTELVRFARMLFELLFAGGEPY